VQRKQQKTFLGLAGVQKNFHFGQIKICDSVIRKRICDKYSHLLPHSYDKITTTVKKMINVSASRYFGYSSYLSNLSNSEMQTSVEKSTKDLLSPV
jgi:hypothetical protein